MPRCVRATVMFAAFVTFWPLSAFAQQGQIAGTVRDPQGGVMPGVLVIEAMAQLAGLLTMLSDVARRDGSQMVLFAGIDEARFKRQVLPGDRLLLEAELERAVRGIGRFKARASVDGQLVCEARLMAAIRDLPPMPEIPSA